MQSFLLRVLMHSLILSQRSAVLAGNDLRACSRSFCSSGDHGAGFVPCSLTCCSPTPGMDNFITWWNLHDYMHKNVHICTKWLFPSRFCKLWWVIKVILVISIKTSRFFDTEIAKTHSTNTQKYTFVSDKIYSQIANCKKDQYQLVVNWDLLNSMPSISYHPHSKWNIQLIT